MTAVPSAVPPYAMFSSEPNFCEAMIKLLVAATEEMLAVVTLLNPLGTVRANARGRMEATRATRLGAKNIAGSSEVTLVSFSLVCFYRSYAPIWRPGIEGNISPFHSVVKGPML